MASPTNSGSSPDLTLDSWKSIASYLNRDVRTAKRWERLEGLPVHRHLHRARSSVFAYSHEIDAWRAARKPAADQSHAPLSRLATSLVIGVVAMFAMAAAGDGLTAGRRDADQASGSRLVASQVWAGADVDTTGTSSRDGRLLSVVDWETGDLAIRQLDTGTTRRLTNKGTWLESAEMALASAMSPDGSRVAYTWMNKAQRFELRLIGADGGAARLLLSDPAVNYLEPAEWSADGNSILAILSLEDSTTKMVLVPAAGGDPRVLKAGDRSWPSHPTLSPDGMYLAYDFPPDPSQPGRDINLLDIGTGRELPLVHQPSDDMPLGWSPDGSRFLFASDRSGTVDAWAMDMAGGRPRSEPRLVKKDLGRITPLGMRADGALLYGLNTGMTDVHVAEVDPASGTVLASPRPIGGRFIGSNVASGWSPDGKELMFVSTRGQVDTPGSRYLVFWAGETGAFREVPLPTVRRFYFARWCGGAGEVIGTALDQDRLGIYAADSRTGTWRVLVNSSGSQVVQRGACSPDGRTLFYQQIDSAQKAHRVVRRDRVTGAETELVRIPSGAITSMELSVNGEWLALAVQDSKRNTVVRIVPASGGQSRDVVALRAQESLVGNLAWTPDGARLLYGTRHSFKPEEYMVDLWSVPVQSGSPVRIGVSISRLTNLSMHPDGRRIAFSAGEPRSEVWVLEGLASPAIK